MEYLFSLFVDTDTCKNLHIFAGIRQDKHEILNLKINWLKTSRSSFVLCTRQEMIMHHKKTLSLFLALFLFNGSKILSFYLKIYANALLSTILHRS